MKTQSAYFFRFIDAFFGAVRYKYGLILPCIQMSKMRQQRF
jgi:hypothetical protein